MHMTDLLWVLLVLLLVPSTQMKRAGKGRGLRKTRNGIPRDRVRSAGLNSRTGSSKPVTAECSESIESRAVFLDCQDRRLTSVPAPNTWSRDPDHLLLARNQITVLRAGAFAGFEGLKSLDLQQNEISVVEDGAFEGLSRLRTLLLQHNRVSTISEEALIPMPNLRHLRLYDNPWDCRCPLESFIRTMQVPSNRNLGNHARCAEPARMNGKKLKEVDPELLCQDPDPAGDPQADQVLIPSGSLGSNPIRTKPDATTICHTYLFPVPRLDCSHRGLTVVPSGIPEDTVQVDLSHNSIQHLRPRDFQGARSLRTLNLSNNNLEHLDTASLFGLLHLRELDLSDNSLHFIQYGVLEDLYFLSQLKLNGNPWVCDYSIHYLVYWLQLHPGVTHTGLLCRSPPEHVGESVEAFVQAYNRECPKNRQRGQKDDGQTDPELWNTPMELQRELEEDLEPGRLRVPQKYTIIRLS